jgi:hypothetical protein
MWDMLSPIGEGYDFDSYPSVQPKMWDVPSPPGRGPGVSTFFARLRPVSEPDQSLHSDSSCPLPRETRKKLLNEIATLSWGFSSGQCAHPVFVIPEWELLPARLLLAQGLMPGRQHGGFPPTGVYSGTRVACGASRQHLGPHRRLQTKDLCYGCEADSWPSCCFT